MPYGRKRRRPYSRSTVRRRTKRVKFRRVARRPLVRRRRRKYSTTRSKNSTSIFGAAHFCKVRAHVVGERSINNDYSATLTVPGNYLPSFLGPPVPANLYSAFEQTTAQLLALSKQYKWYKVYASKIIVRIWNNANDGAPLQLTVYPAQDREVDAWNTTTGATNSVYVPSLRDIPYVRYKTTGPILNAPGANTLNSKKLTVGHYMSTTRLYGEKVDYNLVTAGILNYSNIDTATPPANDSQRWSWYFNMGNLFSFGQAVVDEGWNQSRFMDVDVIYYTKFFGRRLAEPIPSIADV